MFPFADKDDWLAMTRGEKARPPAGNVAAINGEPLRFFVDSRTTKDLRYLVDLEEHGFNGACGCMDFEIRRRPIVGGSVGDEARCWHIVQARKHFLDTILRKVSENFYGSNQRV